MKRRLLISMCVLIGPWVGQWARAHCEVPCGIYTDELRIQLIQEHITTIEKAMKQIEALSQDPKANANQLIRWVTTKETHAQEIQYIVWQYFMTQRIKPAQRDDGSWEPDYLAKLTVLHEMLITAMKTKQTTDVSVTSKLKEQVERFSKLYFGESKNHH